MITIMPPFLGVAYYPEDWDVSEIEKDIKMMLKVGINVARIGEFAWSKMEPRDGEFDFSWLHYVVDKLKNAGIGVVMGTPTAVPPVWLTKKYPDMLVEYKSGRIMQHSGRRHACSNHPEYLKYSARIVEKMAMEFGNDEGIIGWQIDNEIYLQNNEGCFCKNCAEKYHKHLENKFGTVEEMNKRLNLNLFSQEYDSFDEVPLPRDTWENPHLKQEFLISSGQAHIDFVAMQAKILKKYTNAPIGTDQMPINGLNYRKMHQPLDIVQFNHYNIPENLWECCLWFDYLRTMKEHPFWNTETATCFSGSTGTYGSIKPDGFCYVNSWLPLALGGEATMYWLWRTHWAGHELMHGAVLDTSGRYTYANGEIRKASSEFNHVKDFLPAYKVKSDTALLFTSLNWNIKLTQDINSSVTAEVGFVEEFYKSLIRSGIHPDVIDAAEPLGSYKLLFSPTAYTLEENDFSERVFEWVKNGGVWVVGPMTDIRTSIGTKYKTSPYGSLESITDASLAYILPDDEGKITLENEEGESVQGSAIYELFEEGDFEPLLTVKNGHSAILGKHAAFIKQVGKGYIVMLGTLPEEKELLRIIKKAGFIANACVYDVDDGIMLTRRVSERDTLYIVASIGGKAGEFRFDGEYEDILSGNIYKKSIKLNPYELRIVRNV